MDLELQEVLLLKLQDDQEILPLNLHPHHPFKVTLVDTELVTIKVAVAVVVLQQLEPMQIQVVVMVVLENKIISMVTITIGAVVALVVLTVTLVAMVELEVVEAQEVKVVQLGVAVHQQLMQVALEELLLLLLQQ